MSDEDYQTLVLGVVYAQNDNVITDRQHDSALLALERAVETEAMYEGLCK